MKLYNARVRLNGNINNEVNKYKITAPEIAVLQRVHGKDAVQNIAEVGAVRGRSDAAERVRLVRAYPKGPSADGKQRLEGDTFLASIFGVSGVPLPQEYIVPVEDDEIEVAEMNAPEEEIVEELSAPVQITRTAVPRKVKGKLAPMADAEAALA